MKLGTITVTMAFAAMTLAGCAEPPAELMAMKIELTALKQELEYLREQTEELDPRIRNAEQMAMQVIDEREAPLRLDCTRHRPGVVQTRLAPINVVCAGLAGTATGARVTLQLGNPTSGRLEGVRLTLYSGTGAERGRAETRIYAETTASLRPGAWTAIDVELPALPQDSTNELALRAQIDTISLARW